MNRKKGHGEREQPRRAHRLAQQQHDCRPRRRGRGGPSHRVDAAASPVARRAGEVAEALDRAIDDDLPVGEDVAERRAGLDEHERRESEEHDRAHDRRERDALDRVAARRRAARG